MLMQKRVKLRLLRTGLLLFTLDIAITLGQESLACLPKTWKQNLARYALRQKCLLHYIADNLKTSMRVQKYFPCFSQGGSCPLDPPLSRVRKGSLFRQAILRQALLHYSVYDMKTQLAVGQCPISGHNLFLATFEIIEI